MPSVYSNVLKNFADTQFLTETFRAVGGNNVGSTNTAVRRFATVETNTFSQLFQYTDSPTLGGYFTALAPCHVWMSYGNAITYDGAGLEGSVITKNALPAEMISAASGFVSSISAASLASASAGTGDGQGPVVFWFPYPLGTFFCGKVQAGDILRAQVANSDFSIDTNQTYVNIVAKQITEPPSQATYINVLNTFANDIFSETLRLYQGNGVGSTYTSVRRFSTVVENTLNQLMSYSDSVTEGATFTALQDCEAWISYTSTANDVRNDYSGSALTYNPTAAQCQDPATSLDGLVLASCSQGYGGGSSHWSGHLNTVYLGFLKAGDVIKPQTALPGEYQDSGLPFSFVSIIVNSMPPQPSNAAYHSPTKNFAATNFTEAIRLNVGNGVGSSYVSVRRFSNVLTNTLNNLLSYTDSVTEGSSFEALEACDVWISFGSQGAPLNADNTGSIVTINATPAECSEVIGQISAAHLGAASVQFGFGHNTTAYYGSTPLNAIYCGRLAPNDVLRLQMGGANDSLTPGTDGQTFATIIAKSVPAYY